MLPVMVVVDAPEQTPSVLVEAAVKGCDAALGEGHCSTVESDPRAAWYARIVSERQERQTLHVYLYSRHSSSLEARRQLQFGPRDELRQQWASVGVVIAALVAAQSSTPGEPLDESPEPSPATPRVTPALQRKPSWSHWLEFGLSLNGALSDRAALAGVAARAGVRSYRSALAPVVSIGAARTGGEVDLTVLTSSAGLGIPLTAAALPLGVEARAELVSQFVRAGARDDSGTRDSGSVWRFGARSGLDLVVDLGVHWDLAAAIEASWLRPTLTVSLSGAETRRVAAASWSGFVGPRVSF